jgi:RNA polymerase sigma-70 factor (ECF subfamily)
MEINPNFSDKAKRDFVLIESAKEGNQSAFSELMGYCKDALYFLLLKMVNSKEDAEDLMIETFEKAFRKIKTYNSSYAFSTWLFRIATNHGIDFMRTSKKQPQNIYLESKPDYEHSTSVISEISEDELNPEEEIINAQNKIALKNIIKKLPADYRNILVMRYFEEMSYNEISDQLGLPIGTVKARLFRSRELLLSIFKEYNISERKF